MAAINEVIDLSVEDGVAVVTSNHPPVNALSAIVRDGLSAAFDRAIADDAVKAIVLTCAGRTFFAGADIGEFGKPPKGASLHSVLDKIENAPKPVVAAIHGTSLGGGFETALVLPLPRRRAVREGGPARGQARPARRRRGHAAPAAHRRCRQGTGNGDQRRTGRRESGTCDGPRR